MTALERAEKAVEDCLDRPDSTWVESPKKGVRDVIAAAIAAAVAEEREACAALVNAIAAQHTFMETGVMEPIQVARITTAIRSRKDG